MHVGEALKFSVQALRANKVRTFLTALGLVIGNASVILVVTISITGREYILDQIRAVGSNMIYAGYTGGGTGNAVADADYIKLGDVDAVRGELSDRITAATGVMTDFDRMMIGGKEQDVKVIGSDEQYATVRNLQLLAGRFMDQSDIALRQKVALLTQKLATRLFGSQYSAIGQTIKIHNLQFTVIGTFRERTSTFGFSELANETILIPMTVIRYFLPVEQIDPLYVQAKRSEDVEPLTTLVRQIIESRHRPGAKYDVENLTAILDAAKKIALVLSIVLMLVSAIALVISGIGIMNIMLVTVTERTREIGLRMAVGASRREILDQFLTEAVMISISGGCIGILIGVAVPLSIRFFTESVQVPISILSVVVAFGVSALVGIIFGLLPANRASRLNPTEALRYE
jgi:putative ABC transport system permease protein